MDAKHILVADNDPIAREAVAEFLDEQGYHVTPAADGQEALAHFTQRAADLVLTDWQMPKLDGLGLATQIQLLAPTTPIILCSSASADELAQLVQRYNLQDYLTKPVSLDEMLRRITQALG